MCLFLVLLASHELDPLGFVLSHAVSFGRSKLVGAARYGKEDSVLHQLSRKTSLCCQLGGNLVHVWQLLCMDSVLGKLGQNLVKQSHAASHNYGLLWRISMLSSS
jgi:hypothetical protein